MASPIFLTCVIKTLPYIFVVKNLLIMSFLHLNTLKYKTSEKFYIIFNFFSIRLQFLFKTIIKVRYLIFFTVSLHIFITIIIKLFLFINYVDIYLPNTYQKTLWRWCRDYICFFAYEFSFWNFYHKAKIWLHLFL